MLRHSRGLLGLRAGLQRILACCGLALLFSASPSFAHTATGANQSYTTVPANATQAQLEGELEVLHWDNRDKTSVTKHFLRSADGKRYELKFKNHAPQNFQTGAKVRVKGAVSSNVMYLSSSTTSTQLVTAAATPTMGEQKVAVILVTFTDNASQPFTSAQANSAFFGNTSSSSSFFKENSFGNTWLSGSVFGWYALPIPSTSSTTTIATYAQQAATAAGVNLSQFTRYVYIFPQIFTNPWTGMATIGGSPSQAWLNGVISLQSINHELGHNLGLDHAKYQDCGSVTLGSSCTIYEYADPSDSMGNISAGHYDAFQKEGLGWLNNGTTPPITTVTTSGTYTLDPYETVSSGAKALKILKGVDATTGAKIWYYIEYRQPIGYDAVLPTLMSGNNLTSGVQVRLGTDANISSSYLLNMNPGNSLVQYNSALNVGQSYTDATAGVTISARWANSTNAAVDVTLANNTTSTSCTHMAPSVVLSSSQNTSVAPGTAVSYTVAVANNDSSACAASSFTLNSSVPSGWTGSLGSSALTISPGSAASTTLLVTSPTTALAGSYSVGATATNSTATSYSGSGSTTYSVASSTTTTTKGKKH